MKKQNQNTWRKKTDTAQDVGEKLKKWELKE